MVASAVAMRTVRPADATATRPVLQRLPLRVGEPDDALEQEADRAAQAATSRPSLAPIRLSSVTDAALPLRCAPGAEPAGADDAADERSEGAEREGPEERADVSRGAPAAAGGGPVPPPGGSARGLTRSAAEGVAAALGETGDPLDAATRRALEPRFGADFARVRVERSAAAARSARALGARAYTVGDRIVFGAGQYAPATPAGRRLLAHELAHVVQQRGSAPLLQRAPNGDTDIAAPPAPVAEAEAEEGDEAEGTGSVGGRVTKIIVATDDGLLIIETPTTSYLYELDELNIPQGSYTAKLSVKKKKVVFHFEDQPEGTLFYFKYRINKGQDNPATLLKGLKSVPVEVVATYAIAPETQPIKCLLPIESKTLVKERKSSTPLFKSFTKNLKWHIGSVPLGFLGWIDVDAEAGLSLAGLLAYGYGPGVLSEICLYRPLGEGKLGGSARFKLGAALSPSVNFKGTLKAVASYVGVIDIVSIEGKLDASAIGRLTGAIDARVDLSYDRDNDKWGFDAEALISGVAGLKLTATASAAIEVLYRNVWSKSWKLVDEDYRIGWQGGLRIGNDTKERFDFGAVSILSQDDAGAADVGGPSLDTATAPDPLATEAKVEDEKVLEAAVNSETGEPAEIPDGLSPEDALPIVWYKPLNIYPREIEIPRALQPQVLNRDDGPTDVEYLVGGRSRTETFGVGDDDETGQRNWPLPVRNASSPGKRFQYVEKTPGDTVKDRFRNTFNDRLLAPGTTLAGDGHDVDHVQEKQFSGKDALPNLFPAESSANRSAGVRHDDQLSAYRQTIPNLAGRWFEIVSVQMP